MAEESKLDQAADAADAFNNGSTRLTTLKGLPTAISPVNFSGDRLTSLDNAPKAVTGTFKIPEFK